jgi:flagellar biosynthesis component FlhA
MKSTHILSLISLTLAAAVVSAQKKDAKPAPASVPQQKLELVKVASLNTTESNREFQKNVQLVQQQRSLAVQLLSKLQNEQDEKKHAELKKQLDGLQAKLNENNKLMFKTYGFTLNRNYVLTVEKAHIHMWVTADEAAAIKARSDAKDGGAKTDDAKKPSGLRGLFGGNKKK